MMTANHEGGVPSIAPVPSLASDLPTLKTKRPLSAAQIASLHKCHAAVRAKAQARRAENPTPTRETRPLSEKMNASLVKAREARSSLARARRLALITDIPATQDSAQFWAEFEETERGCAGIDSPIARTMVKVLAERRESLNQAPKGNLTSQWLAKNGASIRSMLVEHLSHKLPTSRRIAVIEDHVHEFLKRLIEKDTLASYLAVGKPPQPSVLRIWVYQSACTEMRGWGVDASLRKSRGAKTNRDRLADAGKMPQVVVQSSEAIVERRYEVENGEFVTDLHDPNAASVEDTMARGDLSNLVREMLANRKNRSANYKALVEALVSDEKQAALALQLGMTPEGMSSILNRLRDVVGEAT